ncbi:hypothetical protein ASD24_27920 [Paenibacillus sp. Root52]|nr:hypothetical protein ASD24_27920 [Paenibacillus sp. Root52]
MYIDASFRVLGSAAICKKRFWKMQKAWGKSWYLRHARNGGHRTKLEKRSSELSERKLYREHWFAFIPGFHP